MSDEFLYGWRQTPRPEFAEALKERIFREPPCPPRRPHRIHVSLLTLLLVAIIVACTTPQIRTPVLQATETVITEGGKVAGRFIQLVFTRDGKPDETVYIWRLPCGEGEQSIRLYFPPDVSEGPPRRVPIVLIMPEEQREQFFKGCEHLLSLEVSEEELTVRFVEVNDRRATLIVNEKEHNALLTWEENGIAYLVFGDLDQIPREELIRRTERILLQGGRGDE